MHSTEKEPTKAFQPPKVDAALAQQGERISASRLRELPRRLEAAHHRRTAFAPPWMPHAVAWLTKRDRVFGLSDEQRD